MRKLVLNGLKKLILIIMVVVIKKDAPLAAIKEDKAVRKGFDAKKYAGKIKFPVDGLTYQKQVRDEWE